MVFFVIACSLPQQEEVDIARFVDNCIGTSGRPLGEVYPIEVSSSLTQGI